MKDLITILFGKTGLREAQITQYRALGGDGGDGEDTEDTGSTTSRSTEVGAQPVSAFAALVSGAVAASSPRGDRIEEE